MKLYNGDGYSSDSRNDLVQHAHPAPALCVFFVAISCAPNMLKSCCDTAYVVDEGVGTLAQTR